MIGFMAVYTTVALSKRELSSFTVLAQCRPLTVIWDSRVTAVCFSPLGLRACAYFNATCGIFADLVFALLPIPMLWNIKINMRVKIALFAILSLGLLYATVLFILFGPSQHQEITLTKLLLRSATAACIVKVVYLSFFGKYNDFLWDSVNITIWASCELNIGIFAASIDTLKPLFRATFASSFGTGYLNSKDKSMEKNGFVKHISNSRGTSQIGGPASKDDGFEMYDSVVTANGKRGRIDVDNESEESILPLQNPGTMKITQVNVSVHDMQMKKGYSDEKV